VIPLISISNPKRADIKISYPAVLESGST